MKFCSYNWWLHDSWLLSNSWAIQDIRKRFNMFEIPKGIYIILSAYSSVATRKETHIPKWLRLSYQNKIRYIITNEYFIPHINTVQNVHYRTNYIAIYINRNNMDHNRRAWELNNETRLWFTMGTLDALELTSLISERYQKALTIHFPTCLS